MNHTIYSLDTGEILKIVNVPDEMLGTQFDSATQGTVEGLFRDNEFYIVDGAAVSKPPAPSKDHTFNWVTKTWEDVRDLAHMQLVKWNEIKKERSKVEFAPFTYDGMVFDGDAASQRRLAGYISVSKHLISSLTPFSADFTLANNQVVNLTAQDFIGIEQAKISDIAAAFAHANTLRTNIMAATTVEEVNSISW